MTSILTVDLGTSVTKVGLWDDSGMQAVGRVALDTVHGPGGKVEQDPQSWWPSLVDARHQTLGAASGGGDQARPEAVVLTGARQTFVPVDHGGIPLGPALVWSDQRAATEADELARRSEGAAVGPPLDGAAVAAKVRWLARHEPARLEQARFLVGPRDFLAWRLCGDLATDTTMASATGLYDREGQVVADLMADHVGLLPPVVEAGTVVGTLTAEAAGALRAGAGTPVVLGAADRPSEVVGSGAGEKRAMVAWGTTANVSLAVDGPPDPLPEELAVTRGALQGWLLEGGVSDAGSLLAWLASMTGWETKRLLAAAKEVPPGAEGLVVLPWLHGARAPWWRSQARGALMGLRPDHHAGTVARAVLEAVACELTRCLEAMARHGGAPEALAVGGSSATDSLWLEILAAVSGLAWLRRRSGEAALAGAAVMGARALGVPWHLDDVDPVTSRGTPQGALADHYRRLRPTWDATASTVLAMTATNATLLDTPSAGGGRRCP